MKQNAQLAETNPVARKLGDMILANLERHPKFMSGALPLKVVPPLFNRYAGGQNYGAHVDGAVLARWAARRTAFAPICRRPCS